LISEVKKRGTKRILLQFPEGLRRYAHQVSRAVEDETTAITIISTDPCYGACDIPIFQAEKLGVDLIAHFGHTKYRDAGQIPILYLETPSKTNSIETVKRALPFLKGHKKIGIATTIQHIAELEAIKDLLKSRGLEPVIGRGKEQIKYAGQIIGCNYSAMEEIEDKVDVFLLIGSMFHALGASLTLRKNVILADPYQNRIVDMKEEKRKELGRRWAAIAEAKQKTNFGIIISTKFGQFRFEEAKRAKRMLREADKRGTLLLSSDISPEILEEFSGFDAYINTACPRLSIDDADRFRVPLLSVEDVEIMVGLKKWTSYVDRIYPEERTRKKAF